MNTLKVGFLMLAMTALLMVVGYAIGRTSGITIAFAIAACLNIGSYWFSDKLVIASTGARLVSEAQAPELYRIVRRVADRAQIPMPQVYMVNDPSPNAFATGRDPKHGVVAVNTGLMSLLNEKEVEGVVAHEVGHIKHRDTLTMAIVATLAGAVMMIAQFARFAAIFGGMGGNSRDNRDGGGLLGLLFAIIVAPIAAVMIQMGVSRAREYEADKAGAEYAGSPLGLASALEKLHQRVEARPSQVMQPQTSHLCIVNPFGGLGGVKSWFSTHPPVEERIRRLREMQ